MKIDEYLANVLKRQEDWVRHVIDMSTLGDDDRFAGWLIDYFRVVVKKDKNVTDKPKLMRLYIDAIVRIDIHQTISNFIL